ncbi:MAG: hypothetical protein ACRDGQ_06350 [Candidatus Limnocylindrales bacterium]
MLLPLTIAAVLIIVIGLFIRFSPAGDQAVGGSPSAGGGPSAGAEQSPSAPVGSASVPSEQPSGSATRPYRLSLVDSNGSASPSLLVSSAADCQSMPTDWLRSFCTLTLQSDWRGILSPTDPFADPPNAYSSVSFLAASGRAEIEGDPTFCADIAMREFISAGIQGGAPPPGSSPVPLRPIADCLAFLRNTAGAGSFMANDPDSGQGVRVYVDPGAAAQAAKGSAPAFDPRIVCAKPLPRIDCGELIDAVTAALSSNGSVTILAGFGQPIECSATPGSCAPPLAGTWLGSVRVGLAGSEDAFYDVARVNGQAVVTEVPAPSP